MDEKIEQAKHIATLLDNFVNKLKYTEELTGHDRAKAIYPEIYVLLRNAFKAKRAGYSNVTREFVKLQTPVFSE